MSETTIDYACIGCGQIKPGDVSAPPIALGRCPRCNRMTEWLRQAPETPAWAWTPAERKRLEYARHLVQTGRLNEGVEA